MQRPLMVAPIQALMQAVPSKDQLQHLIRTLKPGQELEPEKLIVWLAEHGYNRLDQVEVPGDFAVRGGSSTSTSRADCSEIRLARPPEAARWPTGAASISIGDRSSDQDLQLDTLGSG
jgi:hypothetical protein